MFGKGQAVSDFIRAGRDFADKLRGIKRQAQVDFEWYPYGSIDNAPLVQRLLDEAGCDFAEVFAGRVADVGAADGDMAFFLESLGLEVDIIDHAPTNFNGLRGAHALREALGSSVQIHDVDLDARFHLPQVEYSAVLCLGLLYHIKNPMFLLERLRQRSRHVLLSTRIAQQTVRGTPMQDESLAYLLAPDECNQDATNYWIFSRSALRRLVDRCGWDVLSFYTLGDTQASNPAEADHDERAFALLRRR